MYMLYSARRATEERCGAISTTNSNIIFEDRRGLPLGAERDVCRQQGKNCNKERVFVHYVHPRQGRSMSAPDAHADDKGNIFSSKAREELPGLFACASVVLLGIDATPDPGLRGPTNFLGVALHFSTDATSGLLVFLSFPDFS